MALAQYGIIYVDEVGIAACFQAPRKFVTARVVSRVEERTIVLEERVWTRRYESSKTKHTSPNKERVANVFVFGPRNTKVILTPK